MKDIVNTLEEKDLPELNKFDWQDPLRLDKKLSDSERLLVKSVREFANKYLLPKVEKAFQTEHVDRDVIKSMGDMGLLGSTIPEEYGGIGANYVSYGLIAREIERVDSGYRSMMSVQSSLVMYPIFAFGNEIQKKKYLPKLAKGELIGCFGLTESEAGSDPGSMTTSAEKVQDGFIINGAKMWISNSPIADVFIIWAKSKEHDNKIKGFILEKGMKGLSTPIISGKMSLRASVTGEIILKDVFVPENQILQGVSGLKGPFECLNRARYGISWGVMGAAEFCLDATLNYGLNRKQFRKPLAQTQLWQKKLVEMQSDIAISLQACLRVGKIFDQGKIEPEMISIIKRNNCEKALNIARMSRDLHGGNGIMEDYHVMRHMCNLETVNTYEGTNDVHALILGRALTGLQGFF